MRKLMLPTALVLGAALAACSGDRASDGQATSGGSPETTRAVAALPELPEGATRVGEELTPGTPVALAEVRRNPSAYVDKVVLVEATAENVCQAVGCWMTIGDGGETEPIWVRWSTGCGGKYAFPKSVPGSKVWIQGELAEKEISEDAAEHLASESDGLEASEILGKTFEINATACVILPEKEAPAAS